MKAATRFAIVLVTAPDLKTARRLARAALRGRVVACANLLPGVESHYWWKGQLESSREVLILFKTRHGHLRQLERLILKEHPYDTPEFVVVRLTAAAEKYLHWLQRETETAKPSSSA